MAESGEGFWKSIINYNVQINLVIGLLSLLTALIGVAGTFIGIFYYIRSDFTELIDRRINNDEYIKKINEKYRPYVIFEKSGNLIINKGVMDDYIDRIVPIKEKWGNSKTEIVNWIRIYPKKYLNIVPILEAIDESHIITPYRENSEIIYNITPAGGITTTGLLSVRFRLEVIP